MQGATVSADGFSVTIEPPTITGTLLLQSNGRYTVTASAPADGVSIAGDGTYRVTGSTIEFDGDNATTATFSGSQVTVRISDSDGTVTLVYVQS